MSESQTIAVMQPYFLPYIGYFQLIREVDTFVILDDVNFIKRGWINRNRILKNGEPYLFTLPVINASQNRLINQHSLFEKEKFSQKFRIMIQQCYCDSPYFSNTISLIDNILSVATDSLTEFVSSSLSILCKYLQLSSVFIKSSEITQDKTLKGQNKIIGICKTMNAARYINLIGGLELYQPSDFTHEGISLEFIQAGNISYTQSSLLFIPNLSILDVLMSNTPNQVATLLEQYTLLRPSCHSRADGNLF